LLLEPKATPWRENRGRTGRRPARGPRTATAIAKALVVTAVAALLLLAILLAFAQTARHEFVNVTTTSMSTTIPGSPQG